MWIMSSLPTLTFLTVSPPVTPTGRVSVGGTSTVCGTGMVRRVVCSQGIERAHEVTSGSIQEGRPVVGTPRSRRRVCTAYTEVPPCMSRGVLSFEGTFVLSFWRWVTGVGRRRRVRDSRHLLGAPVYVGSPGPSRRDLV